MDEMRRSGWGAGVTAYLKLAALTLALILTATTLSAAQAEPSPISLQQAIRIALEKNPQRKAALADTKAASADIKVARSFLMPHLTFSETGTRGNDPVYVFGSKLRQQRFNVADFALNQLNTPLPLGNFSSRFSGTWSLFDSFASWHAVNRAKAMDEASAQRLAQTDQEVVFRVVENYERLVLTRKQLEVAEQSMKTAQAIVDRSQARFDTGVVVEADLLSAKVRLAARQQELIRAENNVAMAQAELNTAMGMPVDSVFVAVDATREPEFPTSPLADLEKTALVTRPDLKRLQSEESAQRQSVSIAKSSFGPRINAFAGWQTDNPTLLAGGGGNNWLGGIEVQIDLFQGGAKRAQLARERALEERVSAMKQSVEDNIRLQVRRAYFDRDASRQQVGVARTAIAQAKESLRMNQDRYDGGLTTITELLGAEESARRSQTDYWEALYRYYLSYASLELACGTLNLQSPLVTQ